MPVYHTVRQGECVASIGERYGFWWQSIWNHSKNSNLKSLRIDPNVLMPGDIVFVPDKSLREESRGTEQRHRFRKKNVPAELVIRIMSGNEPRANEKYSINVDGSWHEGSTDSQGYLRAQIPPGASSAKLFMGGDTDGFELALGQLDPSSEVSGAQARLANLGIYHGEIHGKMDDATVESLRDFQRAHGLQETGKLDKLTQDKLSRVHGS